MTLCIAMTLEGISTSRPYNQSVVSFSIMTQIKRSLAMDSELEFPQVPPLLTASRLTEIFLNLNAMVWKI